MGKRRRKNTPRGRRRICPPCPQCGGALCIVGTDQRGHVTSRWAVCPACGHRACYVQAGDHRFFRVRMVEDAGSACPFEKA